ncbi:ABC transporter permease [Paenibacillus agilis]|uniref:FtsX-like permease family protein n=1 Tax=Paenibacillus agilis TaxID=3020863 RepID=A0A559IXU3_9BACL|nr:ABC transporter permease [Paenibacillus agilis]TVX92411.1 FtsX-like permease family protein [Paenibacillus agilis]
MNIINQLTMRYMKHNKSRTIVTIIGAVISVAMLTAVFTIKASFMDMMQREAIHFSGKWNAAFLDVAGEDVDRITNKAEIEGYDIENELGFARLANSKNSKKPYLYVTEHSNHDLLAVSTLEGRLPKTEDELVISKPFMQTSGVPWKVGDVITLEFGERSEIVEGVKMPLVRQDPYYSKEVFTPEHSKTYTITGIVQAPAREYDAAAAYRAFSGLSKNHLKAGSPYTVSVEYKDYKKWGTDVYKVSDNIASNVHRVKDQVKSSGVKIEYHRNLLLYSGISNDDRFVTTMYMAVITIGTIIMIGSISLIYNAFAISLSERSRALGMLSSVGATKQQKRASVFFEATVIGIFAIPVGLLFGSLGIGVTFELLSPFIQRMFSVSEPIRIVIEPFSVIAVILVSILTLFISAWLPAVRASRITTISAIRQNKDIEMKSNDVRTSKVTRKWFGFEAELGLKNIKRNKHHYRTTVFSLAISVILFLAASSFSLYLDKSYNMAQAPVPYDVSVYVSGDDLAGVKTLTNELMTVKHVSSKVKTQKFTTALNLKEDQVAMDIAKRLAPYEGAYTLNANIVSLDDTSFTNYLKTLGINNKKLEGANIPAVLVNQFTVKEKRIFTDITQLNVNEGTDLSFSINEDGSEAKWNIQIASITDKRPPFMHHYQEDPSIVTLVVSEHGFDNMLQQMGNVHVPNYMNSEVQFTTEQSIDLENEIVPITNSYPSINAYTTNLIELRQSELDRATVISVFLYGFVILIGLICTATIINTISTGMALRKREFAMLTSVGMTPKSMKRMIRFEGLFYAMKSLLYGLPISLGVIYFIYKILSRNFSFDFTLPWVDIILAVVGVFFIVGLTILYATRKQNGQNIVEALKNENS